MNRLLDLALSQEPIRLRIIRNLLRRFAFLRRGMSVDTMISHGVVERPHYAFCFWQGARLAQRLGFHRMTAIEFGVAGGNGLIAMERIAPLVERETRVAISIVGFDSGTGMPPPRDYRDASHHWQAAYFPMDEAVLRQRLTRSHLCLGDIGKTLPAFLATPALAESPIGAVIFDVDYYSSTKTALDVFRAPDAALLPRVACYFDDMESEVSSDFTGVRLAVREFNDAAPDRKISPFYAHRNRYGLRHFRSGMMCFHQFSHHNYEEFVGDQAQDSALNLTS